MLLLAYHDEVFEVEMQQHNRSGVIAFLVQSVLHVGVQDIQRLALGKRKHHND